jgi:fatty-acyl-CoA synthase
MHNRIELFLEKRARLDPRMAGLVFEGRKIDYARWHRRANQVAHAFADLGIAPGDRVGLLLRNSPELLECFFGLARLGAIVVPLNWRLVASEISFIAKDSGIRALVCDAEFDAVGQEVAGLLPHGRLVIVDARTRSGQLDYEDLLAAASEVGTEIQGASEDPATIIYTSGTTGRPKGAVLTHENLFYGALTVGSSMDWRRDDRVLVAMPLFHIGSLIVTLVNVVRGATTVLMESFDADEFLGNVEGHAITSFVAADTMLHQMSRAERFAATDLSSLRWILAGPVSPSLQAAWCDKGIAIQQVYALTETSGAGAVLPAEHVHDKVGSTGLPMFHTDIRIESDAGGEAVAGEVGEIRIRAPHVMRGYWNAPDVTAEALENDWLSTGDLGRLDEDGFLFVVGRKKDMIRSGGENVYPSEVEIVLSELPQIEEVAVVGVPDATWGELVCAVARLREGGRLTQDELAEHCRRRLGRYKIPRKLVVTQESLPRGPTGRVQKNMLEELLDGDHEVPDD